MHPLRSSLTVLGIFIGVSSVIWLLAIGEGISQKAQEQIEGLGARNIIVRSVKPPNEAKDENEGLLPYGITREDVERLTETIPTIRAALPTREYNTRFRYAERAFDGRLVGCSEDFARITNLTLERGRFITKSEQLEKQNVCVLGSHVAERLFGLKDPIGQTIRNEEAHYASYYIVVGELRTRGPTAAIAGLDSQDFGDDVFIPIETFQTRIGDFILTRKSGGMEGEELELSQVTLVVDDIEHVLSTAAVVQATLSDNHRLKDYVVVVPMELLERAQTTRLMFIVFLGLMAAVSLIVGGVGIMNIMLASVTERTREIGIRRALGAKRRDIVNQFLAETVVLAAVGGATGVIGGFACPTAVRWLSSGLASAFPVAVENLPEAVRSMTPVIVPWSIPLAMGISLTIGIVFGIYPAIRAARMDPIEALRHE